MRWWIVVLLGLPLIGIAAALTVGYTPKVEAGFSRDDDCVWMDWDPPPVRHFGWRGWTERPLMWSDLEFRTHDGTREEKLTPETPRGEVRANQRACGLPDNFYVVFLPSDEVMYRATTFR